MIKSRIQIKLAVVAMATLVPMTAVPLANESAVEVTSSVAEKSVGNTQQSSGEKNTNTGSSKNSDFQTLPNVATNLKVEVQTRFNEIRSELLDERALFIDRWLAVVAIVLTFFGVIVAIAGFVGFRRFREIEEEAKASAKTIADAAEVVERDRLTIRKKSEEVTAMVNKLDAKSAAANPKEVTQTVANVQDNPDASLVDKAIADAISLQQQGEHKDAIEKWRAIAQISEESDDELAARAWFSIGYLSPDEDVADKLSSYSRAINLKPNYFVAYVNRGNAKGVLGRHKDAIADYNKALEFNPNLAEAYSNRGVAKDELGQYVDAIADYNKALELDPNLADAYSNRGVTYDNLGRFKDAIADYDEAIRLSPASANVFNNRGTVKSKLEQNNDAIADFNKALKLNPDYGNAYANRGVVRAAMGRHEDAIADYSVAIRLNPEFAYAYLERGKAKMNLEFKDEAKSDLQTALVLARKFDNVDLVNKAEQSLHKLSAKNGD